MIVGRCAEATFSRTGKYGEEGIDGLRLFKYLWWLLYQLGENWLEVLWNIRKARQVWGRLGKLLRREEADPSIIEFVLVNGAGIVTF